MKPNLSETRKFFSIISTSPESLETIQVFGESARPKFDFGKLHYFDSTTFSKRGATTINRKLSANVPISGNKELVKDLVHLQASGYGIYYLTQVATAEPTDAAGNCRSTANVSAIRTFFLDLDGAPLEPVLELALKPHIVVQTSVNKYHCYWKVENCELADWKAYQKALALKFAGDPSVNDLPRVARIPGFYNLKTEPFLVNVHSTYDAPIYDAKKLASGLGLTAILPSVKKSLEDPSQLALVPAGERHGTLLGYARKFAGQGKTRSEIELLLTGLTSKFEAGDEFLPSGKRHKEIAEITDTALTYQVAAQVSEINQMVAVAREEPQAYTKVEIAETSEPEAAEAITYETKDHIICANQLLERFFREHRFIWWQDNLYNYNRSAGYWLQMDVSPLRKVLRALIHACSSKPIPEQFFENVLKVVKDHLQLPNDFQPDNYMDRVGSGNYINLTNGVLNIKTLELTEHSEHFFSIAQLPYSYNPQATAPTFEKWQGQLFDHYTPTQAGELRQAIIRYMAYCLVPNTNQQKFLLLMGASRGGKGLLCKVFSAVLGQANTANVSLTSLASSHGLTQIPGSKLVLVEETPPQLHHFQLASVVETIKRLAAGDWLVINPKGKKEFNYQSSAKLVMASEFALPFKDAGGGLLRRAIIIPFEKSYAGKEDAGLFTRLAGELAGILNLALAELPALMAEGIKQPEISLLEIDEYQAGINPIANFIDTKFRLTSSPEHFISNKDLYKHYQACVDAHEYPAIERASFLKQLAAVMRGRALTARTNNERGYKGLEATELLMGIEFSDIPF